MNELEQTFVEVASRTIYDAWCRRYFMACLQCGATDPAHPSDHAMRFDGPDQRSVNLAWFFLGMLVERNGPLKEIVKAAHEAWDSTRRGEYTDDSRFFRAITLEALGKGKVFDTFAEFSVPISTVCGRPFTVPRLAIEGAQS